MKYSCFISASVVLIIIAASQMFAQEAEKADAEHFAAAHELLVVMQTENAYEESLVSTVDMQVSQNPALENLGPVLLDFFQKYASWETLKDRFAEIYAASFTQQEILELIEFYQTDLGKKVALMTPRIQQQTAKIGFEIGVKHQAELQRMIMEEMESQQDSETDPNFPY